MGLTDAYTEGMSHALHALAWLGGALTVLLVLAAWLGLWVYATRRCLPVARRWHTTRRLHREHARSGRA